MRIIRHLSPSLNISSSMRGIRTNRDVQGLSSQVPSLLPPVSRVARLSGLLGFLQATVDVRRQAIKVLAQEKPVQCVAEFSCGANQLLDVPFRLTLDFQDEFARSIGEFSHAECGTFERVVRGSSKFEEVECLHVG